MFDVDIAATENYLNVPPLYNVALPPAYNAGARVHSNSWTTYYMSSYTTKSLDVDEFMFDNPDFLFIAGAGNSGNEGYNSVTSPAVSKNAITVGASSVDHNNIVYFSSLGSAYDSAFKPNLVTPGRNLMSAGVHLANQTESCNVQISSGTSMATPIAAGSAILIRHYLENSSFWGQFCNSTYRSCPVVVPSAEDPNTSDFISAALLRAMLVGSAQPMTKYESNDQCMIPETTLGVPPDNFQGKHPH
jgi:subtilisin family serine protease